MTRQELLNRKRELEGIIMGCDLLSQVLGGSRSQKSINNDRIYEKYSKELVEVNKLLENVEDDA